ncbi:NACHT domain-containing protein [Actinophytocola sp.]|uniref:NACHT domain-containing protein n=1 Tax=Actinophytocola sp. TaxID=1872138 RepID=UPI002ED2152F
MTLRQGEPFDGLHGPIVTKQRNGLWRLRLDVYTEYANLRIPAGGAAEVVDELIEFAEAYPKHSGIRDAAVRALEWVGRTQEAADLRPRDPQGDRNAHGGPRDELLAYLGALRTTLGRALRWHPGEELAATFCRRSVRMVSASTAYDVVAGQLHLRNRGLVRGDADWDDAVALPRLIVVLGDAGYGKTWQLRRHGQVLCDRAMSALHHGADITAVDLPMWLHASALAESVGGRQSRAEQLVDGAIRTVSDENVVVSQLLRDHLIRRLTSGNGRLLVLVDAYDEVFDSRSKDSVQAGLAWLGRQVRAGDGLRVILTSRPVGYVCPFSTRETTVPVHHVELAALTVGQVRQLWQTWFTHLGVEVPEPRLQPLLSRDSPLAEHVQVPLIAAFCAWVAQDEAASRTRVGLYEQVIRRFIGMWWKQGDQSPHGHNTRHDPVRQQQIRHALEQLAWHMAAGEGEWRDWVDSKECESELQEAGLSPLPGWSRTAELVDLHGVLLRLGNRPANYFDNPIAWVHPNVHEYLAANSLVTLPAQEVEYWLEHGHNRPEWAATVVFAAELEAAQGDT